MYFKRFCYYFRRYGRSVADAGNDDEITCAITTINLDGSASSEGVQFEYQWLDSNDEEISTNIDVDIDQADTYTLIVFNTDNGCTSNASVIISEDTETPIADAGNNDEITCSTTTINLDGSASSEGAQFEYQWLDSNDEEISTNIDVDIDQADTYTLIVTNTNNGCTSNASVDINENTQEPIADAGTAETITCNTNSVALDGTASSAGAEFEYQWLNSNGNEISTEVETNTDQPGTFQIIVTNTENGCSSEAIVEVDQDIQIPVSNAGPDEQLDCATSVVELNGSGSSTGTTYEYLWLNSNNTTVGEEVTVEAAAAGVYTLVVTNIENGCTASSQAEVTASTDFPTVEVAAEGVLNCINSVVLIDGNGSSEGNNYEYQWLNDSGQLIGDDISVSVNTPGSYTFLVSNTNNGCSASSNIIIEEDINTPIVDIANPDILDCVNNSTILDASNSSANGDLNFSWSDENGNLIGTDESIDVSIVGLYNLIITNTENGCTASGSVEVMASTEIPTAVTEVGGVLNCNNGSVIISGENSSANGAITYSWQDQNGMLIGIDQGLEVSNAGTYTLIVTDSENGCSASTNALVEASTNTPVAVAETSGMFTCNNDLVSISGSDSSAEGNLTYIWQDSNQNEIGTTEEVDISIPGTYTLIIIDEDNGCSDQTTIEVLEDIQAPIALAEVNQALNCNLSELNLDGSGSSTGANITYQWSTNDGNIIGNNTIQNPLIDAPGTYNLQVINNDNGCSSFSNIEVEQISVPALSIVSISDASCFGEADGIASLSTSGGAGPYSYLWSNNETGSSLNNLLAGAYTVSVTDILGCEDQIEVNIIQPEDILVQLDGINNNVCSDDAQGAISTSITGGNGNYSYQWSNGMTTPSIFGLESGMYTLLVTDQSSCQKTEEFEINSIDNTAPTVITQDIVVALDENGMAVIDASMINNGTTDNCGVNQLIINQESFDCTNIGQNEITLQVTDLAGNVANQTAIVTIEDNIAPVISCIDNIVSNSCESIEYAMPSVFDNCSATAPVLIEGLPSGSQFPEGVTMITYQTEDETGNIATCSFSITVENTLESSFESDDISCFGENDGNILAMPSGGTPGYSYLWNTGETTQSISDITAGEYSVVITDDTGCQFEETITLNQPSAIAISTDNIIDEMGTGGDGSIEVSVSGGTPGYSYTWTDTNGEVISNEEDLLNVSAGSYTLMVSDANGCTLSSETYTIDNIVSISNLDFEKYIKINPNPTTGEFSVNVELEEAMTIQLSVLDINGRILIDWNKEDISSRNYQVSLANFPNGVYLARVIIEGKVYVQRVILTKS